MNHVLITGASSGIGEAFAYAYAKKGAHLILAARNQEKLLAIKALIEKQYPVTVQTISIDLSAVDAAEQLVAKIRSRNLPVDILINNAGFSTKGLFHQADFRQQQQEMMLNMVTLTELAYLFTQEWVAKKQGAIINIASAAAFQATPYSAVYSATKAYVLSLTEALHFEYRQQGIYYLAVCPGPTDTAFFEQIGDFGFTKKRSAKDVVKTTFKAAKKQKIIAADGWFTKLRIQLLRFLPRKTMTQLAGIIAGRDWNT